MLFKEQALPAPLHTRVIASPNKHAKYEILFYHPLWNYESYFTSPSVNVIIAEKQGEQLLYSLAEYTDFIQRLSLLWTYNTIS